MSKQSVKVETLTPIHIGSGRAWMPDYEFILFTEEREIALIDEDKVVEGHEAEDLEQFISHWVSTIEKEEDLLPLLRKRMPDLKPADVAQRVIKIIGKGPHRSELKEQLHLGNPLQPCIPGSSLKGSMRTAILNQLINDQPDFVRDHRHLKSGRKQHFKDLQVIAKYFGEKDRKFHGELRLDANQDFLRMLRVNDIYLDSASECHQLEIINDQREGWGIKHKETSYVECIPAGVQGKTQVQIPDLLMGAIQKGRYKKTGSIRRNERYLKLETIFGLVNKMTKRLLDEEILFWEEENNPSVIGQYYGVLKKLRTQLDELPSDSCIIRVGAASGWSFMTGGWPKRQDLLDDQTWNNLRREIQKRNYPDFIPAPKTRKLLAGGMPLGFVKLTINN